MQITHFRGGMGTATVQVKFNGHSERCLVDTGSPLSTVMSNEFFTSLPKGSRVLRGGVAGNKEFAFQVRADEIDLGGRKLKNRMLTLDERDPSQLAYSCILGLDIMGGGTLHFDFPGKTLRILRSIPGQYAKHQLAILPSGHFVIPFTVGPQTLWGLWDSGASGTMVDQTIVKAHPLLFERVAEYKKAGLDVITDTKIDVLLYRAKDVEVGGAKFDEIFLTRQNLALSREMRPQALVGFNLIDGSNWMFDLVKKEWARF